MVNQEKKILLVLDNIKNSRIKSIYTAIKLYNILYSTLQIYIYSIFSIAERYNSGYKLIQLEKDLFVDWIISIDLYRTVSRSATVTEIINILLAIYSNYFLSTVDKN